MCRSEHSDRMMSHLPLTKRISMMRRRRHRLTKNVKRKLDRLDKCKRECKDARRAVTQFKRENRAVLKQMHHLHCQSARKQVKFHDLQNLFTEVCIPQVPLMEEDEAEASDAESVESVE